MGHIKYQLDMTTNRQESSQSHYLFFQFYKYLTTQPLQSSTSIDFSSKITSMAEISSMYKYLFLVVLIACFANSYVLGRQIKSIDLQDVNDFRPTNPGISPGAGHSFNQRQPSFDSEFIVSDSGNDFRPTNPGISPGAGHSRGSKIVNENFPPTSP